MSKLHTAVSDNALQHFIYLGRLVCITYSSLWHSCSHSAGSLNYQDQSEIQQVSNNDKWQGSTDVTSQIFASRNPLSIRQDEYMI